MKHLNRRQQTIDYDQIWEQCDNKISRQKKNRKKNWMNNTLNLYLAKLIETIMEEEIEKFEKEEEKVQPPIKILKTDKANDKETVNF